jgi:predicted permease
MPSLILWTLKGLALGFVAAGLNFFILLQGLRHMKKKPAKTTGALAVCYTLRFAVSLGTLILAYFCIAKSIPFLVGTAFGLTIPNYFYFLFFKEKQNYQRKE